MPPFLLLDAPLPVPADSVRGSGFPAAARVRAADD